MKLKLDYVLRGVAVREYGSNSYEYALEFTMSINGVEIRFQSQPLEELAAVGAAKEIMEWARQYSIARKKISVLTKALTSVSAALLSVENEMEGII